MKLRRPTPGQTGGDPNTALINVAFLLLVFFMLVGRMDATAPFSVEPPVSDMGQDLPAGGATLSLAGDGRIALDGVAIDAAALRAALEPRLAAEPGLRLRLNAHARAPLAALLPLVSDLEGMGFGDVVLVLTPEAP